MTFCPSDDYKQQVNMDISKKKKVLFFLPSNTGGAERMTITIAKMLPKDKFEVKFVIVHRSLGTITQFIPKEYEILHIPIHNIWCATTLRMARVILKEKVDIVFCSLLYLNARLILAAKMTGTKVIVRNNIDLSRSVKPSNIKLVKATYRWADKVIAQQEEMHDEIIAYTGLPADRVITMHNPMDTEMIDIKARADSPYNDGGKQLKYVWVARFSQEKGHDLLVKAFAKVHTDNKNAHLYLVGKYDFNNKYDKEVKALVETNKLEDCVHFVGFDNNPYRWVKNADVYVMPSRLEGLPNSLIDAMYLGKPVVATRCIPVIDRIVEDGYNGYVVPSEDVDAISDAMIKAPTLRAFNMTFISASKEDFIELFNNV